MATKESIRSASVAQCVVDLSFAPSFPIADPRS